VKYAIRLPANDGLLRDIEELLTPRWRCPDWVYNNACFRPQGHHDFRHLGLWQQREMIFIWSAPQGLG
jgi:hypothetical protein